MSANDSINLYPNQRQQRQGKPSSYMKHKNLHNTYLNQIWKIN